MPDIVVAFFLLGILAGLAKSDLVVPKAAYDTLSILLMLTLGIKGGLALHGQVSWELAAEAVVLILIGAAIPLALYPLPLHHWRLISFALIAPVFLAMLGLAVGVLLDMPLGSTLILSSLVASASYIAAPAAIRSAIKEADVGIAIFASLGITFPFNVLIGIPLYYEMLVWVTG